VHDVFLEAAALQDAGGIALMVNNAYRGRDSAPGWTSEVGVMRGPRSDVATIEELIAAGRATVLIARDGAASSVIGCICVEPLDASTWYFSMIAVDPKRQAQGLGKSVISAAENYVLARGARRARMTVVQIRRTLIDWYRRQGYQLTGETEPFPYGDDSVGVPLRDDLHFVVLEKVLAEA
jgi:ribosomal protein S18 acetylase RimI-like enzyme